MLNPAFAKYFLPWVVGCAAVFVILLGVRSGVGDDSAMQVVVLTVGVAVILAVLVGFNALKKRL